MKKLSISLVLLSVLTISTCAIAPPPPGSLAEMRQQARKAIESDCLNALWLKERRTIYLLRSVGRLGRRLWLL